MNPWEKIPNLEKLQDVIEKSLRRASKEANKIPFKIDRLYTAKRREIRRINTVFRELTNFLSKCRKIGSLYMKSHPFYKELVSLYYPEDQIFNNLKRIRGLYSILTSLRRDYIHRINVLNDPDEIAKIRREALGRMISVVNRREEIFNFFSNLLKYARRLPSINLEYPLVIVAGPPNVGKSTLVRSISTAKTEVAEYPFTTKAVTLGHMYIDDTVIQIMDTPGLLDSPIEEKSKIEKQAILALKYVSDILIFMFDLSPQKFYPIENQKNILETLVKFFRGIKIVRVVNKIDITDRQEVNRFMKQYKDILAISALTGEGLDDLLTQIKKMVKLSV